MLFYGVNKRKICFSLLHTQFSHLSSLLHRSSVWKTSEADKQKRGVFVDDVSI